MTDQLPSNNMITSIRMVNFKNFADETLRIGSFTVIVGSNASGKSNVRDAFRFLQGIGRGYTLTEIVSGKWGSGGQREWQPIRGASNEIVRLDPHDSSGASSAFSLHVEMDMGDETVSYSIKIEYDPRSARYRVVDERVRDKDKSRTIYETRSIDAGSHWVSVCDGSLIEFEPGTPVLTQINRSRSEWAAGAPIEVAKLRVSEAFANMRFWDLSPELMRHSAYPGTPLGDRGENLPAVLEDVCADSQLQSTLVSWLQALTPMDVSKLDFWRDPTTQVHLTLCESNGRKISADSASDGTLRFLAMLTVLLGKDPPKLCFFEEIDAGIHAARQWLLLKLIETQAAKRGIQIVTTTHSPEMLTYANDRTFEHVSVVCRTEDANDAVIRPVAGLYNSRELRKSRGGIGALLAEGWMETAVAFAHNDEKNGTGDRS